MFVYLLLLAVVTALGIPLCSGKCGKWGKAVFCGAAGIIFIVVSAVRLHVGTDFNIYASTFLRMVDQELTDLAAQRMEKGFVIPIYALNLTFEKYTSLFLYVAIFIYTGIFWYIYRYSSNPWLSTVTFLCMGLYFNSINFLRQMMAAVIIAYAIQCIDKKQLLHFVVFVLAAGTFHWSALIILPFYFLLQIKPGYIYLGITTAVTVIFCIFSRSAMYYFTEHFYMYSGYDPANNPEASTGLAPRYLIMFGVVFIVAFLFRKQLAEKNHMNAIYLNCLMFATMFEAFGTRHAILSRFTIVIYIPILLLVPDLVVIIKDYIYEKVSYVKLKKATAITAAIVGSAAAVGCYIFLICVNYNGVMPYNSIINKPSDALYMEKYVPPDVTEPDPVEEDEPLEEDLPVTEESAVTEITDEDYDPEEDNPDWYLEE